MPSTDHYFSEEPEAPSRPHLIEVQVRGFDLRLHSDRSVFSRARADRGTLLLAAKAQLPADGDILDLGCGYGILGIVAARACPNARVTMVDVNTRATELAATNARENNAARVTILTGHAPDALGAQSFDAILCNPPYSAGKRLVMELLADAARRLRPGGSLWIVGRTKQGIKTLARDISEWFDSVETVEIKSGFRLFRCRAGSETL